MGSEGPVSPGPSQIHPCSLIPPWFISRAACDASRDGARGPADESLSPEQRGAGPAPSDPDCVRRERHRGCAHWVRHVTRRSVAARSHWMRHGVRLSIGCFVASDVGAPCKTHRMTHPVCAH